MEVVFWGLLAVMLIGALLVTFTPAAQITTPKKWLLLSAFALVPLATAGTYMLIGRPDAAFYSGTSMQSSQSPSKPRDAQASAGRAPAIASLIDGLEQRLASEPEDGAGWLLLAQSYDHLGRVDDARIAYERARQLGKTHVSLEASLYGAAIPRVTGEAPPHASIRGRVALAPEAIEQLAGDETVFIFAKSSVEQRMPVAAIRKPVAELPLDFTLTNREILIPDDGLEDYDALVVVARISPNGNASDLLRNLEAASAPVSPLGGENVNLLIKNK